MGKNVNAQMEEETILGIAPLLPKEKRYGFIDFFLIISGFSIATWCYTQGAYSAQMVSFKDLVLTTFGISIFIMSIVALPVILSVRSGIDVWVWFRTLFGYNGCKVLTVLAMIVYFPWYSIAAGMFGSSISNMFSLMGISVPAYFVTALSIVSILIGTFIALGGPEAIKWSTRFMVPAMLVVGIIVVVVSMTSVPIADILNYQPDLSAFKNPRDGFMYTAEGIIAFAFSWVAAMFVPARLCKTEAKGYWGTVLPYSLITPFFIFAGGVMAIAMFVKNGVWESDPTAILSSLASPKMALLSLILVGFANIGTQGVGSYMNAVVMKSSFPKVKYSTFVILLAVYCIILTCWGKVVDNYGAFLAIETYLYAPLMSVLFVDFFFVKHQKISLRDAYFLDGQENSIYRFTKGFNIIGLMCLLVGFVAGCLVYNPITGNINSKIFYVITGSGTSFLSSGLLYFMISKTKVGRKYLLRSKEVKNDVIDVHELPTSSITSEETII